MELRHRSIRFLRSCSATGESYGGGLPAFVSVTGRIGRGRRRSPSGETELLDGRASEPIRDDGLALTVGYVRYPTLRFGARRNRCWRDGRLATTRRVAVEDHAGAVWAAPGADHDTIARRHLRRALPLTQSSILLWPIAPARGTSTDPRRGSAVFGAPHRLLAQWRR